jgi:Tfp pilus assembly protein PilV
MRKTSCCFHRSDCAEQIPSKAQSGVALILSLICLLLISLLAAGLILSTQTEIWTTSSYRSTAQARYVAEAGAQQAIDWLQANWKPPVNLSDTSQFNLSVFPAQYVGAAQPQIVFAPLSGGLNNNLITDNYHSIDSTLDSRFQSNLVNQSVPFDGMSGSPRFSVAAQLLSATQVTMGGTGSTSTGWMTKWKIISQGTVGSIHPATVQVVEVVAMVPNSASTVSTAPRFKYAMLATGTGCGAIAMSGGQYTNAYNSVAPGNVGSSNPALLGTGGDVASFGNINLTNGAYINGNVYSPFYNTGATGSYGISCQAWSNAPNCHNSNGINGGQSCSSPPNEWAVNEDNSGSAVGCTSGKSSSCSQMTYSMPPSFSSPSALPDATMPDVPKNTSACTGFNGLCNGGSGGGSGCAITVPPNPTGNYGVTNFGSCAVITLQAGTYNFDTLYISNGAKLILPSNGSVVVNIHNASNSSTPLNQDGGTVANNGGDPNNLTFVYNGDKTINLNNGSNMFATIYAPHAKVIVGGNAGLYGAIVGSTFQFSGSGHIIYDTNLGNENTHVPITTPGGITNVAHIDAFSWSAF